MKFEFGGYEIIIAKKKDTDNQIEDIAELEEIIKILKEKGFKVESKEEQKKRALKASKEKAKKTWNKIEKALNIIKTENNNFSEYNIAKKSGCSINTIKKYRKEIEEYKKKSKINNFFGNKTLFEI